MKKRDFLESIKCCKPRIDIKPTRLGESFMCKICSRVWEAQSTDRGLQWLTAGEQNANVK
jgi:hypothetical protein